MRFAFAAVFVAAVTSTCALAGAAPAQAPAPAAAAAPASRQAAAPLEVAERSVAPGGVTIARLDNGLTVILKATHSAPVVCVRAYVQAGSLYEGEYVGCGLSHLLEHLVAKGEVTEDGPRSQAALPGTRSRVNEIGGMSNASTSMAWTQYYISAASSKTMDCIDLIADWMARPEISQKDFDREHGVVQREVELGKDHPGRQMWYAHSADVFASHPAGVPVIGYIEPIRRLTRQDVLKYHARMYVPQNMVFTIVGDIDVEAALQQACKSFAGFARGRVPDLSLPAVRPFSGVRRGVRGHPGLKEAVEEMSFQTIPLLHEDLHALDVLCTVLARGESSRLVDNIQRKAKLVTNVSASSWTPHWGRGLFNVSFRAAPDKADQAEKAILDELRNVAAQGVRADELARAKRQMVATFVREQQSVESLSSMLASDYLTTGDAAFSKGYTKLIESVTPEQLRDAARRYFRFDAMVITRLVPPEKLASGGPAAGGKAAEAAKLITLPNGLRVVLSPTDAVDLVSMALAVRGGLLTETPQTNGLGSLMADLSTKGAGGRSAEQIAEFFANAGGDIDGACGNNSLYWQATVLSDSLAPALEIFADVVVRPTFPAKELEILRPIHLASLDRVSESWFRELQQFFRAKLFGQTPYGMTPEGRREVIEPATAKRLAEYHRDHVKAGDSVLAIYGNFDAQAAEAQVRKLFADLPPGKVELPSPPAPTVAKGGETHVLKTDKKVAAVMMGWPGMKVDNLQDRFALDVLDTILSGYHMPSGWLHTELRGKQLVYVVHAYDWLGLAPGAFIVYAAGQPEKTPEVLQIIRRNLAKAAHYKPAQSEVDEAVNVILTADLLQTQSMSALAMSAALDELYGFGFDFRKKLEGHYRKVTPDDVLRVGGKYLASDPLVTVSTPTPQNVGSRE